MKLSLIVAMDRKGLIGCAAGLPWHLPADLKRFRKLTMGKPILMGRKTLEAIGRPLPGRRSIVLTHQRDYSAAGVEVVHSLEEALDGTRRAACEMNSDEAFVIGGAEVFRQAIPAVELIYLTIVDGEFNGDAWFPLDVPFRGQVVQQESHTASESNHPPHRFLIVKRAEGGATLKEIVVEAPS